MIKTWTCSTSVIVQSLNWRVNVLRVMTEELSHYASNEQHYRAKGVQKFEGTSWQGTDERRKRKKLKDLSRDVPYMTCCCHVASYRTFTTGTGLDYTGRIIRTFAYFCSSFLWTISLKNSNSIISAVISFVFAIFNEIFHLYRYCSCGVIAVASIE